MIQPVRGEPGVFVDSGGRKMKIVEHREDDVYDSVDFTAAAISAGTEKDFFQSVDSKKLIDTNLKTPRRISGGTEMVIERLGVQIPLYFGNTAVNPDNVCKLAENGAIKFKINTILIAEGPVVKFPSGYGMAGNTVENDTGIVSVGVPSTAAQARLKRDQFVNKDNDLDAVLHYDDRTWRNAGTTLMPTLDTVAIVKFFLHGLVRSAATKG